MKNPWHYTELNEHLPKAKFFSVACYHPATGVSQLKLIQHEIDYSASLCFCSDAPGSAEFSQQGHFLISGPFPIRRNAVPSLGLISVKTHTIRKFVEAMPALASAHQTAHREMEDQAA
jgi:hypothetical protein